MQRDIKEQTDNIVDICTRSYNKFHKHSEEIINVIKAINILDNYSNDFPSTILKYTNTSMFLIMNEYNLARIKKPTKFELHNSELFLNLSNLISRLDSIRCGISKVERMFSFLKLILKKQRLNLKNETIEKTLFLRCNSKYLNKFQEK